MELYPVAPFAGAWIETYSYKHIYSLIMSRPSRARGLKQGFSESKALASMSRPSRARGLKHRTSSTAPSAGRSRPSRARGLKLLVRHCGAI